MRQWSDIHLYIKSLRLGAKVEDGAAIVPRKRSSFISKCDRCKHKSNNSCLSEELFFDGTALLKAGQARSFSISIHDVNYDDLCPYWEPNPATSWRMRLGLYKLTMAKKPNKEPSWEWAKIDTSKPKRLALIELRQRAVSWLKEHPEPPEEKRTKPTSWPRAIFLGFASIGEGMADLVASIVAPDMVKAAREDASKAAYIRATESSMRRFAKSIIVIIDEELAKTPFRH